ncbi:MAG: hypothetical protein U0I48_12325 [Acutalibacteraceae bacterium]|jgi:xanthine/uracil permease|nr:hypothetical protein [Acutalibacteraceae bacterium]
MKRFLQHVVEWKTAACYMFTGTIILYMLIAAIMGQESASLITLLGLLIISSVGTLIQYLCFTQNIIKKMRYTGRLFLFLLLFLPVLTACALTLHWFPPQYALGWLIFIGIFLLVFAAMTLGFEIFYRVTGKKYDGLLGQYKRDKEKKTRG